LLCGAGTALLVALGSSASASTAAGPACGGEGAAGVVDAIDERIAHTIYANELNSSEVASDLAYITSATFLSRAVAADDRTQTHAATHRIVYTPIRHIVRLRVLDSAGHVLADVGGPYILAPVTAQITYEGKVVGSFVMSVQDDRGYKKLVSHIADVPIELYRDGKPLMGTVVNPPSSPPSSGPLTLGGANYDVDAYTVEAFPNGALRVAVLVPAPKATLAAMSCPEVRLATDTAVVERVASGLMGSDHSIYQDPGLFIRQAYGYVPVPIFLYNKRGREVDGSNDLPDSSAPPPGALPSSGSVTYAGTKWLVSAIRPYPPDWIYVLAPANVASTS
jgi:hypothetical protein